MAELTEKNDRGGSRGASSPQSMQRTPEEEAFASILRAIPENPITHSLLHARSSKFRSDTSKGITSQVARERREAFMQMAEKLGLARIQKGARNPVLVKIGRTPPVEALLEKLGIPVEIFPTESGGSAEETLFAPGEGGQRVQLETSILSGNSGRLSAGRLLFQGGVSGRGSSGNMQFLDLGELFYGERQACVPLHLSCAVAIQRCLPEETRHEMLHMIRELASGCPVDITPTVCGYPAVLNQIHVYMFQQGIIYVDSLALARPIWVQAIGCKVPRHVLCPLIISVSEAHCVLGALKDLDLSSSSMPLPELLYAGVKESSQLGGRQKIKDQCVRKNPAGKSASSTRPAGRESQKDETSGSKRRSEKEHSADNCGHLEQPKRVVGGAFGQYMALHRLSLQKSAMASREKQPFNSEAGGSRSSVPTRGQSTSSSTQQLSNDTTKTWLPFCRCAVRDMRQVR